MRTAPALCLPAVMLALMASSCGEASSGAVRVWIDAPLSGGQVNSGDEVEIRTHAYSGSGVAQIELQVDGQPYSREAPDPAGGDLVTLGQTWIATSPGVHTLQVAAYGTGGSASSPAVVTITVLGAEPPEQALTTPTAAPLTTVTGVAPTASVPAAQLPSVNFNVDDETISAGGCTFLRWQVQNAQTITLDGMPVASLDARQVCPQQTTSYVMRAASAVGEQSETVQVQVSAPPAQDTTPPLVGGISAQPGQIFDNSSCGADSSQITAGISDAGTGVGTVELHFQVLKPQTQQTGQWVSLTMQGNEKQGFTAFLGPSLLRQSLDLYGGASVQYYIVASDNAGNSTQSKSQSFKTQVCIF